MVFVRNRPLGVDEALLLRGVGDAPETIVFHKGHGLPYSKGLMAQSLSAIGLAPERSFELARAVERRLAQRGAPEMDVEGLEPCACEVLLQRRARAPCAASGLEPARTARPPAGGADRRHHRSGQVHARHDARRRGSGSTA